MEYVSWDTMTYLNYVKNPFAQGWIQRGSTDKSGVFVASDYMDLVDQNPFDAMALAQIMYWADLDDKTRKPRMKTLYNGCLWIVKTHEEWRQELRFKSVRTVQDSFARLEERGLIFKERHKSTYKEHNGQVVLFIRPNWDKFGEAIHALAETGFTFTVTPETTPDVNPESPHSVILLSEITAETLQRVNTETLYAPDGTISQETAKQVLAALSMNPHLKAILEAVMVNPAPSKESGAKPPSLPPSSAPPPVSPPVTGVTVKWATFEAAFKRIEAENIKRAGESITIAAMIDLATDLIQSRADNSLVVAKGWSEEINRRFMVPKPPKPAKKPTKPSRRQAVQHPDLVQAVKDALVAAAVALGKWQQGDIGKTQYIEAEDAACDLCDRGQPVMPEEVASLMKYTSDAAEDNDWSSWTLRALDGRIPDWRKTSNGEYVWKKKKKPAPPQQPSKAEEQQKSADQPVIETTAKTFGEALNEYKRGGNHGTR